MQHRTTVALVALQFMLVIEASGQQNIIKTVAGSDGPTGGTAAAVGLEWTDGLAVDGNGNYYFSVPTLNRVYKVDPTGQLSVAAGNGIWGFGGDGGPAANAELIQTLGVAVDVFGNLYLADSGNYRIRRVDAATGIITTIAGTGVGCPGSNPCGDGGPATNAQLNNPQSVAVDAAGDVFIADPVSARVRRVSAATGIITTVAGNGTMCSQSTAPLRRWRRGHKRPA